METFRQRIQVVALTAQDTKFILTFKYLKEILYAFLPQTFTHKESVFSFKLKRYIDCFPSINELITMAGQMQKELWGREVMEQIPHISD